MKRTIKLSDAAEKIVEDYRLEYTGRFSTTEQALNDLIFQFSLMLKDAKDAKKD